MKHSFFTNLSWGGYILLSLIILASCQRNFNLPDDTSMLRSDEIAFRVSDPSLSAEVATKATAVTSLSSFNVSAVTGSAGSETAVWTNVPFSGNNDAGYKADKWWPAEDASYRFYASNSALSFAASGATVAATNATDVICAYAASPSYKSKNTLSFEHIFARLGAVTVSAATGYTISGVSIKITPKTGGTYNLLTGAGHTDGTGWSGLTTGSETVIASATGSNANDIYLVPGTYTLTASWTAARGLYTENIQNMQVDVNLTAGKINTISTTLSGNAKEVVFSVNIAPWTEQNQVVEFPTKVPTFAGLQIAPGNLYYDGSSFQIADEWTYNSYHEKIKLVEGSSYFTFENLASYFSSAGNYNEDIDNANTVSYGGYNNWRIPTLQELKTFIGASGGSSRSGSIVNGVANSKYALIKLTGINHAGTSTPNGLLLFPDDATITGRSLSGINNNTQTTEVTVSELNVFLSQGCAFLPASAYSNGIAADTGMFDDIGCYWSATIRSSGSAECMEFSSSNISFSYSKNVLSFEIPVRLVRNI